jgi:hypothetical protein
LAARRGDARLDARGLAAVRFALLRFERGAARRLRAETFRLRAGRDGFFERFAGRRAAPRFLAIANPSSGARYHSPRRMSSFPGLLLAGLLALPSVLDEDASRLFAQGRTFAQFLETASAQRERWSRNAADGRVPLSLVNRLRAINAGLRVLIVAEDWCPDSVNTVPYIVRISELAGVPVRIVDRQAGQAIMQRHRASDGRTVTPVAVLLRGGEDVGAWIERPQALQELFLSLRDHPEHAERFAQRQSWYDADGGRSTLAEFVELAERTSAGGAR